MIIKTFDAFTRLSYLNINTITHFLHAHLETCKDSKKAIRKSLLYAAKEIPSLGGYVFVIEEKDKIIGAVIINKTGMSEYQSENFLVYLAVHQEFRNKGVASKLIKKSINYCNGNISLNVAKENSAIRLFEKKGFKQEKVQMVLNKESA
jgi:ribosomal protein S18 acetylase RimI-like enzyme